MNLPEMLGEGMQRETDAAVEANNSSYWGSFTAEQLREILDRGLAAGDAFTGAAAEIERRAGDTARRARILVSQTRGGNRRLRIAKLVVLAAIAAVAAGCAAYWLAY
jgi:hypothetical protein